jgi:hypothetical protein
VNRVPRFAERLPAGRLAETLRQSDGLIRDTAGAAVQGNLDACRRRHTQVVQLLADSMKTMTPVNRFLYRGWHASISLDDNYRGGIWGCAENHWLDELIDWTNREIELLRWTGGRRLLDYYGNDPELMKKYYPQDVRAWLGAPPRHPERYCRDARNLGPRKARAWPPNAQSDPSRRFSTQTMGLIVHLPNFVTPSTR